MGFPPPLLEQPGLLPLARIASKVCEEHAEPARGGNADEQPPPDELRREPGDNGESDWQGNEERRTKARLHRIAIR